MQAKRYNPYDDQSGAVALDKPFLDFDARDAVNDGSGNCSSLTDRVQGATVSQATMARRPVITSSSGVTVLSSAASAFINLFGACPDIGSSNAKITCVIRGRLTAIAGNQTIASIFNSLTGGSNTYGWTTLTPTDYFYRRNGTTYSGPADQFVVGTMYTFGWAYDGSNVLYYKDGTFLSSVSAPASVLGPMNQICLLNSINGSSTGARFVFGKALYYNYQVSSSGMASISAQLAATWPA